MTPSLPDLRLLEGVVAPNVLDAMHVASRALKSAGIRHVIVGGLAVGAYGYPRATRDVDFLVGDEAFEHHPGGVVTMKPGAPIQVAGVAIDFLSIGAGEGHLEAALAASGEVAPATALVFLKLKSPRLKDLADVVELIKAGLDAGALRAYLQEHAPGLVPKLEQAMASARQEESR
jgi:hypothetical protein